MIKSVSVLGDYVVKFDFQQSVAEPERRFLFKIVPAHLFGGKTVLSKFSKFSKNPIGTGYYKFDRETKNHDVILNAFKEHYGGAANIDEVKMVYQPEMSLLVQSLLLNAIDLVVEVPPGKIAEIANTGKFMIIPYNSLAFAFFGYNSNNPILRIKEVRQAFTMGMDRNKMLEDIYFGKGEVISGPVLPGFLGLQSRRRRLALRRRQGRAAARQGGHQGHGRRQDRRIQGHPPQVPAQDSRSTAATKAACRSACASRTT